MDNLRETIAAAVETTEEEPTVDSAVQAETTVTSDEPTETLESASSDETTDEVVEKPVSEKKTIDEVVKTDEKVVEPRAAKKPDNVERAPASWRGDAKKVWNDLPQHVKLEVAKRERETSIVFQENAKYRGQLESFGKVVDSNRDLIQAQYKGDPVAALSNMMTVDRNLTQGTPETKAAFVAHIIKHFGIDVRALDGILSGQGVPQEVSQASQLEQLLDKRLAPVMSYVQQRQQDEQRQAQQTEEMALTTVEQMAADPEYPYFQDVRAEMADLIEMSNRRGIAMTLPEAYNKAVRLNDQTYQASVTRHQSSGITQQALAAHQQAQRAKGAAVSISGSPNGISDSSHTNPNDLRSVISSQFGDSGARL